jgi:hypothetical protein
VTTAARSVLSRAPAGADYLGPAQVVDVEPGSVGVELPDGSVARARMALAVAYEPVPGDTLLVIGNSGGHYVIGVLHGTGRCTLAMPGDVEVRASGGVLRLSGDHGVELRGPEVEITATKLHVVAGAVMQRFVSLCQRVTGLLRVHAGEVHRVVDGDEVTQAKTATILTEGIVTINGKQIHLG